MRVARVSSVTLRETKHISLYDQGHTPASTEGPNTLFAVAGIMKWSSFGEMKAGIWSGQSHKADELPRKSVVRKIAKDV